MKRIVNIYIIFLGLIVAGCGDFEDTNLDPKSPTTAQPGYLFASAEKVLADWKTSTSVNFNVMRLASQYWSQVTYTNESRYDWEGRQVSDQMWLELYSRTLSDLREAKILSEGSAAPKEVANMQAQITVLEVFVWQLLVDAFGDIPYNEALDAANNASPKYDDAADIYQDLITRLDAAIGSFDATGTGFTKQDIYYGGDINNWIRFANSLKMRLGIRLADVDPALSEKLIVEATPSAFTDNKQNVKMPYENDVVTGNPMYNQLVISGRTDYVTSNTFMDVLNNLNDPRRAAFFELVKDSAYVGLTYGKINASNYELYSVVGSMLKEPEFPASLMCYSEVEFILAEAAQRGFAVSGTAESHYNAAVRASIMDWGGTEDDAANYLAQPSVAFATAEGGNAMRAIATQKWISFYIEADQGWIEWKRFDYPIFNVPENLQYEDLPLRYQYPTNESSINKTAYEAAIAKMGGDKKDIRLFWDTK